MNYKGQFVLAAFTIWMGFHGWIWGSLDVGRVLLVWLCLQKDLRLFNWINKCCFGNQSCLLSKSEKASKDLLWST